MLYKNINHHIVDNRQKNRPASNSSNRFAGTARQRRSIEDADAGVGTYEQLDEARYNLATRIMSNGVEVIIANDKSKSGTGASVASSFLRIVPSNVAYQPLTLAPSTLTHQMILAMPTNALQQNYSIPINGHQFITKTCLTTYTYRTTYLKNGHTTVQSREKVVSNIATEEGNYLKLSPVLALGVTLTRTPELAVGIFSTTYTYYNTLYDGDLPLVFTSEHTVMNTVTGPDDYISFLQPSEEATPALDTNTYYRRILLTRTISEGHVQKLLTTANMLTQVIVTKSQAPHSTSVLTSYFAYDTDETLQQSKLVDVIQATVAMETVAADAGTNTPEQMLPSASAATDAYDDMHIYATKTYITTFTYYTTTSLIGQQNAAAIESAATTAAATGAPIKAPWNLQETTSPPRTVVNYRTRIIENVITESVPGSLLHAALVSSVRAELHKTGKYQRRVIVTMATLLGGQTLQITALNILKSGVGVGVAATITTTPAYKQQTVSIVSHTAADVNFLNFTANVDVDAEVASSELDAVYLAAPANLVASPNDAAFNAEQRPGQQHAAAAVGNTKTSVNAYSQEHFKIVKKPTPSSAQKPSKLPQQTAHPTKSATPQSSKAPPRVTANKPSHKSPNKSASFQNASNSSSNKNRTPTTTSTANNKLSKLPVAVTTRPAAVSQLPGAVNQLIGSFNLNRLNALRPVFDAMAGLLQSNFQQHNNAHGKAPTATANNTTQQEAATLATVQSKQALRNISAIDGTAAESQQQQHIYIPMQNSLPQRQQQHAQSAAVLSIDSFSLSPPQIDSPPQSLHIQPPKAELDINDDNWLQESTANNNNNLYYYHNGGGQQHVQALTVVGIQQQIPLLNGGGIPIRPGELITTNSDVIIGKPNGIQVPRLPDHQIQQQHDTEGAATRFQSVVAGVNEQQPPAAVSYYQHFIEHPAPVLSPHKKKLTETAQNTASHYLAPNVIPLREQHQHHYQLQQQKHRPHLQISSALLPPHRQQQQQQQPTLKLHTQHQAAQHLNFDDALKPPPLRAAYATKQNSSNRQIASNNLPDNFYMLSLRPPTPPPLPQTAFMSAVSKAASNHQQHPNNNKIYKLNNELKHNEILEIKRIPEIFSTDFPPFSGAIGRVPHTSAYTLSSMPLQQQQKQHQQQANQYEQQQHQEKYQHHSNHQNINLDTHVLSHNVNIMVPPLTFKKEADYPHMTAVHGGQIPTKNSHLGASAELDNANGIAAAEHMNNVAAVGGGYTSATDALMLHMPHVQIPAHEKHVQVQLTPQSVIGSIGQQSLQMADTATASGTAIGAFAVTNKPPTAATNQHLQQNMNSNNNHKEQANAAYIYGRMQLEKKKNQLQNNGFQRILPVLVADTTPGLPVKKQELVAQATQHDKWYLYGLKTGSNDNNNNSNNASTLELVVGDNQWHTLTRDAAEFSVGANAIASNIKVNNNNKHSHVFYEQQPHVPTTELPSVDKKTIGYNNISPHHGDMEETSIVAYGTKLLATAAKPTMSATTSSSVANGTVAGIAANSQHTATAVSTAAPFFHGWSKKKSNPKTRPGAQTVPEHVYTQLNQLRPFLTPMTALAVNALPAERPQPATHRSNTQQHNTKMAGQHKLPVISQGAPFRPAPAKTLTAGDTQQQSLLPIFVSSGAGFQQQQQPHKERLPSHHVDSDNDSRKDMQPELLMEPATIATTTLASSNTAADNMHENGSSVEENVVTQQKQRKTTTSSATLAADEIFVPYESSHPHHRGVINATKSNKNNMPATTAATTSSFTAHVYEPPQSPALDIRPPPLNGYTTRLNEQQQPATATTESVLGLNPPPLPPAAAAPPAQTPLTAVGSSLTTTSSTTTPYKTIDFGNFIKRHKLQPAQPAANSAYMLPPPPATAATHISATVQQNYAAHVDLLKQKRPAASILLPSPAIIRTSNSTSPAATTTKKLAAKQATTSQQHHSATLPVNRNNNNKQQQQSTAIAISSNIKLSTAATYEQSAAETEQQQQKQQSHNYRPQYSQQQQRIKPTKSVTISNNTVSQHQQQVQISVVATTTQIGPTDYKTQQQLFDPTTIALESSEVHIPIVDLSNNEQQYELVMLTTVAIASSNNNSNQQSDNQLLIDETLMPNNKDMQQQHRAEHSSAKYITNMQILTVTTTKATLLTFPTDTTTVTTAATTATTSIANESLATEGIDTLLQPTKISATSTSNYGSAATTATVGHTVTVNNSNNAMQLLNFASNNLHNPKVYQQKQQQNAQREHVTADSVLLKYASNTGNSSDKKQHAYSKQHTSIELLLADVLDNKHKQQQQMHTDAHNDNNSNSIFIVMSNNNKLPATAVNSVVGEGVASELELDYNQMLEEHGDEHVVAGVGTGYADANDDDDLVDLPSRDEQSYDGQDVNHVLLGGVLIATPPELNKQSAGSGEFSYGQQHQCRPACKSTRNEVCVLVDARQRCVCRPGFARMFPDRPCKPTYTFAMRILIHRIGQYALHYDSQLASNASADFRHLAAIAHDSVDRMIMQSDFRDVYHGVHLTSFQGLLSHHADSANSTINSNSTSVLANFLLQLSDNSDEKRLESVFKKYLRLSNYSIGGTELHTNKEGVDSLAIVDFDECVHSKFHDCSAHARCFNLQGTYTCSCQQSYVDLSENAIYPGRVCSAELIGCEKCHYHGKCVSMVSPTQPSAELQRQQQQVCECYAWYAGATCQLNLKILLIVLVAIGTLLFILLLFCVLLTCSKQRRRRLKQYLHGSSVGMGGRFVATSTSSQSMFVGLQQRKSKNARLTAAVRSSSAGRRRRDKSSKSINIDKHAMLKDSSSEASQNSLSYVLKAQKECQLSGAANSRKHCSSNNFQQSSSAAPLLPACGFSHSLNEMEQHYPEQTNRSLTVMIPRAKYHHPSVLPQTQLLHHQLTMERAVGATVDSPAQHNPPTRKPSTTLSKQYAAHASMPPPSIPLQSSGGALVSAGFEVSAIVSENLLASSSSSSAQTVDGAAGGAAASLNNRMSNDSNNISSINAANSLNNKNSMSNLIDQQQQGLLAQHCQQQDAAYNMYRCDNDLIDTMDVWLDSVQQNELSAEARSFDETTVQAVTKSLRICFDNQTTHTQDEANTMAERDIGSTFLLPHTHLYKPERAQCQRVLNLKADTALIETSNAGTQVNRVHKHESKNKTDSQRKYVTVEVNGTPIEYQFDTASDITIISEEIFSKLNVYNAVDVVHTVRSATGKLPLYSQFDCNIK